MESKYPGAFNLLSCISLKNDEKVLILIDELSDKVSLNILEEAIRSECSHVKIECLPSKLQDDFPENISNNINQYDVIILAASQSWYHVPSRRNAKYKFGKRVVECYGLTVEMMKKGALCANYEEVNILTRNFLKYFETGCLVKITTKGGTNFISKVKNIFKEVGCYDKPGSGGNLPAGEISLSLGENTACGEIVFDVSFDLLGRLEKYPLIISVNRGKVLDVRGKHKDTFESILEQNDSLKNIAEIGIGTNSYAIFGRSVLEDEKKLGSAHIGFGNNTYFGGNIGGPHLDGVLANATISVAERIVLVNGKPV